MGILQRAAETYDCHSNYIGNYSEGIPIAPVGHKTVSADIIISLDTNGNFLSAEKAEKNQKIIIPITEDSVNRTSTQFIAHPLCEQLSYLATYSEKRHNSYLSQLENWVKSEYSHPFLLPVLTYIKSGTIIDDLLREQLIKVNDNGIPKNENQMVCWHIADDELGDSWTNKSLIKSHYDYYYHIRQSDEKINLCMISGKFISIANKHMRGLVGKYSNAKLISANDESGFTYRGRFKDKEEALTIGYEVSEKAHNALKWLVDTQGVRAGSRVFICWNPQGKKLKNPANDFFENKKSKIIKPSEYKDELYNTLYSFKQENQLNGDEVAVIVAFDATSKTTGRLSLTYYSEQTTEDFLQRLIKWDEDCCWDNDDFGVESPPLFMIINNAFGSEQTVKKRNNKDAVLMKTDENIYAQQMQRLIACKLGDQKISFDIVRALCNRASTPQAYDRKIWLNIVYTACAVLRKYRKDKFGEEWLMSLDEQNKNRSYLFGRLLAIAEKVEQEALRTYGKENDEKIQTNAMKLQSLFSRRPLYAWRILEENLNPYYRRLKPSRRNYYKKLTGTIAEALSDYTDELDTPLEDIYIMGYYNQRQAFYKTKSESDNTEE